jgi:hypothetical protein
MPSEDSLPDIPASVSPKQTALPVEVVILTPDHEVHGFIHVSRHARKDRRLSDLLNDTERRFLAVTDARLISRHGSGSPRLYRFLQLHLDNIIMIHPASQSLLAQADYSTTEAERFNKLRIRLTPD